MNAIPKSKPSAHVQMLADTARASGGEVDSAVDKSLSATMRSSDVVTDGKSGDCNLLPFLPPEERRALKYG